MSEQHLWGNWEMVPVLSDLLCVPETGLSHTLIFVLRKFFLVLFLAIPDSAQEFTPSYALRAHSCSVWRML